MKTLRIRVFRFLLKPFSGATRKRRMALFQKVMKPSSGMKILDLGGQPDIWDTIKEPLNITCLNLPGIATTNHPTHHNITYMEGDACNMPYFDANAFDLVFSNSVIEHVGDGEKVAQFSSEVLRVAPQYWVQTPYKYFPIEAHCGMPFWWLYPKPLRLYFIKKWKKSLPAWAEMVQTTTVISANELREMLPGCHIKYEWFIFPKSLIACSEGLRSRQEAGVTSGA